MRLDRTFSGTYEFDVAHWPGGSCDRMLWYPGASTVGGRDGALLSLSPGPAAARAPWLGVFAPGHASSGGARAAVALPDRRTLAVLNDGAAYRVTADDPLRWAQPAVGGALEAVIVEDLELVLLIQHTAVLAYGVDGPAWHTEQLVWDGLQALRVTADVLHLQGFDAPRNEIVALSVDLRTGRSADAPHPARRLRPSRR